MIRRQYKLTIIISLYATEINIDIAVFSAKFIFNMSFAFLVKGSFYTTKVINFCIKIYDKIISA